MYTTTHNRTLRALAATVAISVACGATSAQDNKATKTVPVFREGQAQIVEGFQNPKQWVQHDLWVETEFDSDGNGKADRVHVDVTRPLQTKTEGLKVPVIYESSPYYSGTSTTNRKFFWNPRQEVGAKPPERPNPPEITAKIRRPLMSNSHVRTWVPRGFAVVHSASPGTGLSQGCPTVGGRNESLAPKAVIDWLNGRALGYTSATGDEIVEATWCTGKVGMTGTSYNGTIPLAAATTGVKGLECIIPIAPNTSYYHYYRSNGLVRHPGGWMGEDIDVLFNFIHSGDPKQREYCNCKVRDEVMAKKFDRRNGDYNDFWAGRDYLNQLGPLRAATLMAHAFNDWNVMPEHSVRIYEAIKKKGVPCQAFFHQGGHGGPPPLAQMNRWFTRYLYDVQNDVEKDPKSWVVRESDRRTNPTPYADYPHPEAAHVTMHPGGKGTGLGSLSTQPGKSRGKATLIDDVSISGSKLAGAKQSSHRLLFATPELKVPLHISGTPRLKIRLACNKKAANLSVWVVSLPWTKSRKINDNIITRGWADPQNHKSLRDSSPLKPGAFYDLSFDLQPDDQIIPAGQRIGLMVFSSDRDFTLWPPAGTKLTVDLEATSFDLPIVGGATAFRKATSK
jgi:X-Pro dipeptidyl-peptidase